MYKGYLKGNGKYAVSKLNDITKLLAYYLVKKQNSFVGILNNDYIMADIDDLAEVLLEIVEAKKSNALC
ncbi:hypothetical protein C1N66_00280 [Bacillus cereus]|uniref:Uncharacterized protein n=1 Tax=Bacillus cereus TaxID=1396 RepID=A0AB73UBF0_BACCE|nr:hypothetical protein [Bacillus cereus]QHV41702.1 hypothetical protein C1N66_00280 [Bacillus cereus]